MDCSETHFSGHAVSRIFERGLSKDDVLWVMEHGETIAEYPDDRPYPSRLILGHAPVGPVHVVMARDPQSRICFVVTAYQPDPAVWSADFRTRRTV